MSTIEAPSPGAPCNTVLLHTITYPEIATSKKPICDMRGYLVGGPDRKRAETLHSAVLPLWITWQKDVQAASRREGAVPQRVMDYFQRTKHLLAPPKEGTDVNVFGSNPPLDPDRNIPRLVEHELDPEKYKLEKVSTLDLSKAVDAEIVADPLGMNVVVGDPAPVMVAGKKLANPPRFATSYSGMKDFLNCPCKWAASKYFKTLPYIEGPEAAEGNRGHLAFERLLKGDIQLPDVEIIKGIGAEKYVKLILDAKKAGAELFVEEEICCTKELVPCGWKDWNTVWFRFKGDVLLKRQVKLNYMDWKFGKRYSKRGDDQADMFQLRVAFALASLRWPDIEEFDGKLIYVKETEIARAVTGCKLTKDHLPGIWEEIFAITNRMEQAWETETFRMITSGLCRNHCKNFNCPHEGK